MSKTLGVREVKARFSHYIEVARTEGDIIITDRGKPVARLTGLQDPPRRSLEDALEEMAESGLLDLGSPRTVESNPVKPKAGVSASKIVLEMRK